MFKGILENGYQITIEPLAPETKAYAMTKFWMDKGVIWSMTPGFGKFPRPEIDAEKLGEHVAEMLREGFHVYAEHPNDGEFRIEFKVGG